MNTTSIDLYKSMLVNTQRRIIMKKFLYGCGQMFYADCPCSLQTRMILLNFQFQHSSNSALALLEDEDVQAYIQHFSDICPADSCPITREVSSIRLLEIEKKPGGLCPVGLWKKALSVTVIENLNV